MNKKLASLTAALLTTLALGGQAYATGAATIPVATPDTATVMTAAPTTKPAVKLVVNKHATKKTTQAHKKVSVHKMNKVSKKPVQHKKVTHKKSSGHKTAPHKPMTDPQASTETGTQTPKNN